MRTLVIAGVAASAVALVLVLMGHRESEPALEDTTPFKDTTNIVFLEPKLLPGQRNPEGERKRFTVSASNEVSHFVLVIRLQRKEPCPCQPHYEATFQKPSGQIHVSFCDHCFDVLGDKDGDSYEGARLYRMPKDFYGEFRRLAQDRERWHVPEP